MQSNNRRKPITRNNAVVAGSVWESRMKMDEVKGGIKVFNAAADNNGGDDEGNKVYRRLRRNQSEGIPSERRKRRNWKPPEPVVTSSAIEKSPIQLRKAKSELARGSVAMVSDGKDDDSGDEEDEEEIEIEVEGERKTFDDKEIDIPPIIKNADPPKKIQQICDIPIMADVDKKPEQMIDPDPVGSPLIQEEEEMEEVILESISGNENTQNRMQNIVDLVMWRDISKSSFVFGFGSFVLLSSSYTKDINFSLITAVSYLGLVYLAIIFLYKSILRRGVDMESDMRDERFIVGEEEAIWVLRLLLPYINEVLIKLRALFSGDPATTMKLAVLLFVMARCGGSVTIWTLAKLVFFGVFTIPKVFSSYSVQITRYGKFWVERCRDGWESCTHKKAVAGGVFALIWNLSSTIARFWAVFMLVVAVRLYQQCAVEWNNGADEEEFVVEEVQEERQEDSNAVRLVSSSTGSQHRQRRINGPSAAGMRRDQLLKVKKTT